MDSQRWNCQPDAFQTDCKETCLGCSWCLADSAERIAVLCWCYFSLASAVGHEWAQLTPVSLCVGYVMQSFSVLAKRLARKSIFILSGTLTFTFSISHRWKWSWFAVCVCRTTPCCAHISMATFSRMTSLWRACGLRTWLWRYSVLSSTLTRCYWVTSSCLLLFRWSDSAFGGKVKQSVVSVCPFFTVSFGPHDLWTWVCVFVWVMTIALLGLKDEWGMWRGRREGQVEGGKQKMRNGRARRKNRKLYPHK